MEFLFANFTYILIAVILVQGYFLVRHKREGGQGFLSRIFRNNKDFDSTLDRVVVGVIFVFMLIAFHDDLKDPAKSLQIVIIFQGLLTLYGQMVVGKSVKDAQNSNGNDHEPLETEA